MSEVREDGGVRREVPGDDRGEEATGLDTPVEEGGPADEELSPWYGDLGGDGDGSADDWRDELSPDVPEPPGHRAGSEEAPRQAELNRPSALDDEGVPAPYFQNLKRRKGKRLVKPEWRESRFFKPEQRLLLLDIWIRSGLPAGDFAPLVGVSKHTLYSWKKRFEQSGPAGLMDQPRGPRKGSKLPEVTKRAILMLKEANPDYGVHRISEMLLRGPALPASPGAVSRVLHEAGFVTEDVPTTTHKPKYTAFERARPNQLWQTDLFTFTLKRTNRRVYLVAFMDDHSRFITCFGLHASASTAMVIETLERGIASYGPPEEILTDNGPQYVTWRGKSAFTKECERRGIRQIVSRPKHPQTLGKIERFWGTLWRECVKTAVFADIGEAQRRIGHFIDYVNFQRPHQGIDGLVPADRFFGAAPEVLKTLKARVAANAAEIARNGEPKEPFYITGNVGGKAFSVHAEGERLLLRHEDGEPKEIALTGRAPETQPAAADEPDVDAPEAELVEEPEVNDGSDDEGDGSDTETDDAEDAVAADPASPPPGATLPPAEPAPSADEPDDEDDDEDAESLGYTFLTDRVKRITQSLLSEDDD